MSKGRYYLGRVVKLGLLDQEKLIAAILNSPVVEIGRFGWTITDAFDGRNNETPFIFGKLSKYAANGEVTVVDEKSKSQVNAIAQNLVEASSPFVYLPQYSGLAFLHVWNGIQEDIFPRRFKSLVEAAYDGFFVSCVVEPVTDYKAFATKLRSIDRFTELSAKVYPPNPLFGRLWGSLNDYVKRRNASDVTVKETSTKGTGIDTNIVNLVENILNDSSYEPEQEPDITDAAILMAADGYGKGKVAGFEGDIEVVFRTSDSHKSFNLNRDPLPLELALAADAQFSKVSEERDMGH